MIDAGSDNFTLATLGPDGEVPATRIGSANVAWNIADQLARDNVGREQKRIRIFKQYNRFPPTEYSKLAQKTLPFSSNVCWGQLEFIVNNQKSSYYDVITERQACAEIKTKFGNERERLVHSENITKAFDHAIREWPGYLYNKEQDITSMLLYGKGIGMWTSPLGWMPEAVPLSDLLFPSNTKVDFSNLEEFVRRVRLTPYQLYKVIKNREAAEALGWNVDAVIDAIRFQRSFLETNKTREEFYRTISEASFNWNLSVNQTIDLYEIYWQEFDGKISKAVVLQDYTPIVSNIKSKLRGAEKITDAEVRDQHGFMQLNIGLFDSWDQILYMVTDSVGSGLFHDIKSQAEACFVACRQYDFTMNSLVDAVRLNSMLLLEGQAPDATKTLKQMEWLPMSIMPDGAKFSQNRITLPVQESMAFMQFYMGDLYRGMGQYRINAPTSGGAQRTRGEAELDAAESAKLSGTQIRRFNECETLYFRELYRRFVSATRNDDGYQYVKRFYEILEELGTPKEAASFKNITSIRSNLINGAGSPSFKLITAERLVNLTSITPANEGQENAVKDAIAALAGRDNVERYRNTKVAKIDDTDRIIGFENAGMTDVFVNPQNFPVLPTDPHIEHATGHFNDLMLQIQTNMQAIQMGQPDVNELAKAVRSIQFKGGHIMAHVEFIAKDEGKKDFLKQFMQGMGEAGKMGDQIAQVYQEMVQAQQQQGGQGMSEEDIKLQYLAAKSGIEIDTKQKLADISIGKASISHAQRTEQREKQGITQLALQKAKARAEIQKQMAKAKPMQQAPEMEEEEEEIEVEEEETPEEEAQEELMEEQMEQNTRAGMQNTTQPTE
jgi:hypothetical protein